MFDLLSEPLMADRLSKGDLLIIELFFAFEALIGDLFVLRSAELFYVNTLDDESLFDLKKSRAGVVAFFLEDENP